MRKFEIKDAVGGAAFTVRVVTRAARTEIAGVQEDGALKVRLTASPSEGNVNQQRLGGPQEHIEIVAGLNSREKLISVDGINPAVLEERLVSDRA